MSIHPLQSSHRESDPHGSRQSLGNPYPSSPSHHKSVPCGSGKFIHKVPRSMSLFLVGQGNSSSHCESVPHRSRQLLGNPYPSSPSHHKSVPCGSGKFIHKVPRSTSLFLVGQGNSFTKSLAPRVCSSWVREIHSQCPSHHESVPCGSGQFVFAL